MIKKIFYKLGKTKTRYLLIPEGVSKNFELENVYLFLSPIEHEPIEDFKDTKTNIISIWSEDSFQKRPDLTFKSQQEEDAFNNVYWEYRDKRWEDMPKVEMSQENYGDLVAKWEKIKQEKPEYVIFTLDDSGVLDIVDVIGKNELSPQDLQDMKREHEEYLLWKKAERLYYLDHELIDDVWRRPADSAYDANIAKYIGRETGFVQHKKYTRLEAITEFKERLQKKEPVYLAVHWLHVRGVYDFGPLDPKVDPFLWDIWTLDRNPTDMARSREQLIEVADRILTGENVQIYNRG